MTGILIVDKPADWTSQDVAAKLRGVFHERRVGHGGTLDPMATGVLPVFLGRATRAVPFFESAEKEYVAGVRFGLVTDTQDTTGRVLEERPAAPDPEAVREVLAAMTGPQLQTPPMYSAVKIGGKKLYELARQGKEVARAARPIELKELELRQHNPWNGQRIRDLDISRQTLIVIVKRKGRMLIPNGDLTLHQGDRVILYTRTRMAHASSIWL